MTHINPDLDAIGAVWILKRFDEQHFGDAEMAFVPAGKTIGKEEREFLGFEEEQVVHVDTGQGKFDHHTEKLGKERICAASMVADYVKDVHPSLEEDEALARMVEHMIGIDHFEEAYWPEPDDIRYLFQLHEIFSPMKAAGKTDREVTEFGLQALDAVYVAMKSRVMAEEELERAQEFETRWGKGLGVKTTNDDVMKLAQKRGYAVVVRKDSEFGHVRIKAAPEKQIDLTEIYEIIIGRDTHATWYLHPSKAMLLNGSKKGGDQVPSELSLAEVIAIVGETE